MEAPRREHPRAVQEETDRRPGKPERAIGQAGWASSRYTIKFRSVGCRLVYEVRDAEVVVTVIAVGKRERNAVYEVAAKR